MQSLQYLPVPCVDASVLHHSVPGMLPPKECIPERFQGFLRAYYSDPIPVLEPAARPLHDILEMLEPLWPQSANKTVEDWRANLIQSLARKIATAWHLPTNARRDKSVQSTLTRILERILVEF